MLWGRFMFNRPWKGVKPPAVSSVKFLGQCGHPPSCRTSRSVLLSGLGGAGLRLKALTGGSTFFQ
jgi:hypothetical protein